MTYDLDVVIDMPHRRVILGGEPMIFHCHHYNVFLQQTLLDAAYVDMRPDLIGAAATVAYAQLSRVFATKGLTSPGERGRLAASIYRYAGFGTLDFSSFGPEGGSTHTNSSHYAHGWKSRVGGSESPVCFFTQGFIAGALDAIYDRPAGSFDVKHTACMACGHAQCGFEATLSGASYARHESPGVGALTEHVLREVPSNPVDYEGVLKAVSGLPLVGNERGEIPAFGVMLTRHFANYYNIVSFALLHKLSAAYGSEGCTAAADLLIEAGRICAFYTFGGIMSSTEWNALIRPSLERPEDWVHGMVAVGNALGWGRWQVTKVSSKEAEIVIHDDYESVGYLGIHGKASAPVSFLAHGGAEGLMNLVYIANIAKGPTLDPQLYNATFKCSEVFRATPIASRAMGDEVTAFRIVRGQPTSA